MKNLLSLILIIHCFNASSQKTVVKRDTIEYYSYAKGHIDFSDTSEFTLEDFEMFFHHNDTTFQFIRNDALELDTNFHYEFRGFRQSSCGRPFRLSIELTDTLGNTLFLTGLTANECDPEIKRDHCQFLYMNSDYQPCGITVEDLVIFLSMYHGSGNSTYYYPTNKKILTIRWPELKTNFNI